MIKKNTKIIFENEVDSGEVLDGGMPLSKGEIVKIHKDGKVVEYIVKDKTVDCYILDKDQEVNITYILKRK